jgi:tetratricopeptide (TPR) repeat protein
MTLPTPRTLIVAALALVVIALAAFGGWAWWEAQQRRAAVATAEVLARVPPALGPDATAEARLTATRDLEQLLGRFPSARTVPSVAYELGNVRFAGGQYAAARAAYDLALQRGATGLIGVMAGAGVARSWEAERDFARAAEAYAGLVARLDPRSFLYEDALIGQARMLELGGKTTEAIAIYQKILKELPAAKRSDDVRGRLASLGATAR